MICQNCGVENVANAELCKNCGATIARRTLANPALAVAVGLAGLPAGIIGTGFLWYAGGWFREIGVAGYGGISRGSAWFYLATLLATCAALIAVFRRPVVGKIGYDLRAFLLVALFVMLGGMSICNAFSFSVLFQKS